MLKLQDGRAELYQWDTDRKLIVDGECSEVHFSNKLLGSSVDIPVVDGVAKIPDELLQTSKDLSVWAYVGNAESGYTKEFKVFKVERRPKPSDYVYTPSEIKSLKALAERVKLLEETGGVTDEQIKDAVDDYFEENPPNFDGVGVVKYIDRIAPDKEGNINLSWVVKEINGILPDSTGVVSLPGATSEEVIQAIDTFIQENNLEVGDFVNALVMIMLHETAISDDIPKTYATKDEVKGKKLLEKINQVIIDEGEITLPDFIQAIRNIGHNSDDIYNLQQSLGDIDTALDTINGKFASIVDIGG